MYTAGCVCDIKCGVCRVHKKTETNTDILFEPYDFLHSKIAFSFQTTLSMLETAFFHLFFRLK